jgi:hypothetical protein
MLARGVAIDGNPHLEGWVRSDGSSGMRVRHRNPAERRAASPFPDGLQLPSETATPMRKLLETPPGDEPEWARAGSGVQKHPRELVDAQEPPEATGAGVAGADGVAAGRLTDVVVDTRSESATGGSWS